MESQKENPRIMEATRWNFGTSPCRSVFVCLLLTSSCLLSTRTVGANICSGCYNGGKLLLPNNIFGLCRCLCPPRFKGLQCEFVSKRSADPDVGRANGVNSLRPDYGRKVSVLEYILNQMKDRQDFHSGSKPSRQLIASLGSKKRGD